jgi:hypothetical protein
MIKTIDDLKALFETGDTPTGQDFIDLIDTLNLSNPIYDIVLTKATGAQTSIPFIGLSATQSYLLIANVHASSGGALYLYANGDETPNNYNFQNLAANDTVVNSGRDIMPMVGYAHNTDVYNTYNITIGFNDSHLWYEVIEHRFVGSTTPIICHWSVSSNTGMGSLDSLNLVGNFAVGSSFKLYRR